MSYDYLFKCIVVGDSGVGKSSLLLQFTDKRFMHTYHITIGVEFGTKTIIVKGTTIKLQIWDTAGQENFRSITRSYYRDACMVLLVYDVTNMDSFNAVAKWLEEVRQSSNCPRIILIGNKNDLEQKRQVTTDVAANFARKNNLAFIETSAKSAKNVDFAFISMAEKTLTMIENREIPIDDSRGIKIGTGVCKPPVNLNDDDNTIERKGCCFNK